MPAARSTRTRLTRVWRTSLPLRIVVTSIVLSMLATSVIGGYMSISIGANLFEQRRDEVVLESVRATDAARRVFSDAITDGTTSGEMDALRTRALDAAVSILSNRSETTYAMYRSDRQGDSPLAMSDVRSRGFDEALVGAALRDSVASHPGTPYYQSVRIDTENGSAPGLVVGTTMQVRQAGQYELYIVYSLQNAQRTLDFMQATMLVGGIALLALIALVTWLVVRMVVAPVEVAAATSAKLASGQLDERIPVHGDDVLATLGRSFNDMADSIREQITRLAKLSTVQQRFVSDVSHELRTPLTTIKLAGDVIYDRREGFDPVTARTAELLRTQIERFEQLLADLLEMSRFDAGAADLDVEPTSIAKLAEVEMESVRPLADERGTELSLVAPGGHFEADVDPRRIRRILQNLLGNAIDHGEGKPVVVTVDSNAEAVAIMVRDHGIGMTEEQSARVFDRFWRADPSRQRRTGGTGLGLAISRDDAALHHGWIDVWSAPGEGTAFRVTLPREGSTILVSPIPLPDSGATSHEEER